MRVIFEFFWLFCGAWAGFGNALFFRTRLRSSVRDGKISKIEADQFVRHVVYWIAGPCFVFWIIQAFFVKAETPFFTEWGYPYRTIAEAVCVFIWVIAFVWIWFLGGDRKLARIYTLSRYQTFLFGHPITFRILALLIIAGGALALWSQAAIFSQIK